jgi:hypothetical protein
MGNVALSNECLAREIGPSGGRGGGLDRQDKIERLLNLPDSK